MTDLPEHDCKPHCLGCCPGLPDCTKPSHQPPRDGVTWNGIGLWNAPSGSPGPNSTPRRTTVYGWRDAPSIGGPSR